MKMNNYLDTLENKVKCLPELYSKDILNDYRSHFHEGALMGKTEDDIANELGDVDFIANNIIAEYYIENSNMIDDTKKIHKSLKLSCKCWSRCIEFINSCTNCIVYVSGYYITVFY